MTDSRPWKPNYIYLREFPDGDCELGVCERYSFGNLMDVGDFAYYELWESGLYPWIEIGEL